MTTTASAVDRVDYVVKSTDVIHAVVSLDVKGQPKMSVFHNMLVGASQPSGVAFDTTLVPNSIFFGW